MRRLLFASVLRVGVLCALLLPPEGAHAATSYYLRFRPAGTAGLRATLAFDLVHADSVSLNRAVFLAFIHDGKADSAEVEAGPGYGDLLAASNPAAMTTLEGQYFFNSLAVPFDSMGTFATVRIDLTEHGPAPTYTPDEFSMYFIRRSAGYPYPTADDLGTDALFVVDITGAPGGELTVFSPMTFIPPDTLALEGAVTDVAPLRLLRVFPNPAAEGCRIEYEVPSPGGVVSVTAWDIAGRPVATVEREARGPGRYSAVWLMRTDAGRNAPAGVYFVQLKMAGQTAIRKVALAR